MLVILIDTIKYKIMEIVIINYYFIIVNDIMLIVNNRLIPDTDIECIQGNKIIGIKPSFKIISFICSAIVTENVCSFSITTESDNFIQFSFHVLPQSCLQ